MKNYIYLTIILLLFSGCKQNLQQPVARVIPDTTHINGVELIDNYAWLKDKTRERPDILKYIEAENNYTSSVMKKTKRLQQNLFKEFKERIIEDDMSVPVKKGSYYYYSRKENNKQYSIYCRKKDSLEADEEIYLDVNEMAKDKKFYSIIDLKVSPDNNLLAYGVDTTGAEDYLLVIKDLETSKYLKDKIPLISDIDWANDNKTLFYSTTDYAGRTNKIYRHIIGTEQKNDKLIFTENDEHFWVWLSKTRNKKYIILGTASKTSTERWFLNTNNPSGEFKLIEPRSENHDYYVLSHENDFYIVTNYKAENNKLMVTSVDHPSKDNWQEVIAGRSDVLLYAEVFQDHLILTEQKNGVEKLKIMNLNSNTEYYVDFEEPIYTFYTWGSSEYDSNILRYTYESLVTPYVIYDYNMDTKERTILKQQQILGNFDKSDYFSERIYAEAEDGSKIPISLVYKKDLFYKNGMNPVYLTAYGAYGDDFDPYFSSLRLSLLDRGIIYSIAHVRGGTEMGEYWYEQGKMLNKKNTFTDFITCAEYLKKEQYADKIIINGGSAGGLLVGAVTNMRPDLFFGVVADVPFVDILNTMLDPSLSAVVSEYQEWGDPNDPVYFDYMRSYSPYDNVTRQDYPHILILAGFYDTRVNYWEPAKWVAKLRANKTNDNQLLLWTNMNAGHSGSSGRYDYLHEISLEYAFILNILSLK
ncbi:MAG: S9 family peptidase [Candidatus Tenebribacter davisii]|jgi:oligopeptidase B|nr:S9 family peptidase [Candidatus Tenebribacter davisii]